MSNKPPRRGREGEKGETRDVGRPLITLKDLPENWEALMTAIYQVGGTDVEVRIALAIAPSRALDHDTFKSLQERHLEFSEAVKYGQALAEAWWWQKAQSNIDSAHFKSSLWMVIMRHRFAFRGADRSLPPPSDPGEQKDDVTIYLPANGR